MHEQAILTMAHPILGAKGSLVSIGSVEAIYKTSEAANANATFKCADPECGVVVRAVITKETKELRKNSPSSYFRGRHVKGCTREPRPAVAIPPPAVVTNGGSPNRTDVPTVWVDPSKSASDGKSGGNGSPLDGAEGNGTGGKSPSGTGTSDGHSGLMQRFAENWLTKSATAQRATKLLADWNPGGTYHSAFHPLGYHKTVDVGTLSIRIIVGILQSVRNGKSGYTITLQEKNSDGVELQVWVQSVAFAQGRAGATLEERLAKLEVTPTLIQVFALGEFFLQERAKRKWYALPIIHPHFLYLT